MQAFPRPSLSPPAERNGRAPVTSAGTLQRHGALFWLRPSEAGKLLPGGTRSPAHSGAQAAAAAAESPWRSLGLPHGSCNFDQHPRGG